MVMMWMDFQCEAPLLAKKPETCQHFFQFCGVVPWVYWIRKRLASFFFKFLLVARLAREFDASREDFSPTEML
jgi:hypothetical protein